MITLFSYMLKISLCYAVTYLFYFIVLKPLTHYIGNRIFLLIPSVGAFFIPLLRLDFFIKPQIISTSSFIKSIPSVTTNNGLNVLIPEESSVNIPGVLMALFIAGIIICSLRLLIQIRSLQKLRSAAQQVSIIDGIKCYNLNLNIIPFSFGNVIYLNKKLHTEDELRDIIIHEFVHVYQKHTLDVLIAEIVCILNWYNPFVWLFKTAIKQNLEFLADDTVIKNGTEKKTYQYLLLKVIGHSPLPIVSGLNFSSLKKRIYMMNKTKNSQKHLLKFLFVLPVIVLIMVAFRNTNSETKNVNATLSADTEQAFTLSELTYSISDPLVAMIIKKEQDKSILQVGKPFNISIIRNERDRLKSLLERNGYTNIGNHSISFLIDSSLTNNSFSVQVNIDLRTRSSSLGTSKEVRQNKKSNAAIDQNDNKHVSMGSSLNVFTKSVEHFAMEEFDNNNMNTENSSVI